MHTSTDTPASRTPPLSIAARTAAARWDGSKRHRPPKSAAAYVPPSRSADIDPHDEDTIELELTSEQLWQLEESARRAFARKRGEAFAATPRLTIITAPQSAATQPVGLGVSSPPAAIAANASAARVNEFAAQSASSALDESALSATIALTSPFESAAPRATVASTAGFATAPSGAPVALGSSTASASLSAPVALASAATSPPPSSAPLTAASSFASAPLRAPIAPAAPSGAPVAQGSFIATPLLSTSAASAVVPAASIAPRASAALDSCFSSDLLSAPVTSVASAPPVAPAASMQPIAAVAPVVAVAVVPPIIAPTPALVAAAPAPRLKARSLNVPSAAPAVTSSRAATRAPWRAKRRLLALIIGVTLPFIAMAVIGLSTSHPAPPMPQQPAPVGFVEHPTFPPAKAVATPALPTPAVTKSAPPVLQAKAVRYANPFDRSEIFEFPAGTSRKEARDAVAQILIERARERRHR